MKKLLILFAAVILLFAACTNDKPQKTTEPESSAPAQNITVYFGSSDATGLVPEIREVSEKTPEAAIEELLKGSQENITMIAEGTSLLGITVSQGEATVDFSREFSSSSGDTLVIYSVVNTLTQFEDIHFVKITVEGSEEAVLGNYVLSEPFTENSSIIVK